MKEFASALATLVPTKCWAPAIRNLGRWETWERETTLADPKLTYTVFPLQRGYARFPIGQVLGIASQLATRLSRSEPKPSTSTLVCTTPFYAPVAERWPGRVIYYLTDLTAAYPGMNRPQIEKLDRRMCRAADLICPNSRYTGEYLQKIAGVHPNRIVVIPNATRASNLLSAPLYRPTELPADLADLPRPVVVVIGNLAYNLDWHFLRGTVDRASDMSFAFVGPTHMTIADQAMSDARADLMSRGGRIRFIGAKPYGVLCQYARSADAALLPYFRNEATLACSATRFYEHLAACRPMISTRAVDELLRKEPLVKLVGDATEAAAELKLLQAAGFRDGHEEARWKASVDGTWEVRAAAMVNSIDSRTFEHQPDLLTV